MQKDNSTYVSVVKNTKQTAYKAPALFSIPANVYCEEAERTRDRVWYLKLQKLQKDSQLLREELSRLAMRSRVMVQNTSYLLAESRASKANFDQRKAELNQAVKLIKSLTA